MSRTVVSTDRAPAAIGTYSQAVAAAGLVFLSGQVPLDPATMELREGVREQIDQVFKNLQAVAEAAGGSLAEVVQLRVYLTDLAHFPVVNDVMAGYFDEPYPARAAIGVAALPKDALVEIEAIMVPGS